MYKLSDHYYQPEVQELVEGETTPLRISQKYLDLAGNRKPNIDWAAIPEMIAVVDRSDISPWFKEDALGHLRDAMNDNLDDVRRMHHFDIAGNRIWEGSTRHGGKNVDLARLMTLFVNAGGM